MRAHEFIIESTAKLHADHDDVMSGAYIFRDNGVDRMYNLCLLYTSPSPRD